MYWKIILSGLFAIASLSSAQTTCPEKETPEAQNHITTLRLMFSSAESFTDDLCDTTSENFQSRRAMTETQLQNVFESAFPSFLTLKEIYFRASGTESDVCEIEPVTESGFGTESGSGGGELHTTTAPESNIATIASLVFTCLCEVPSTNQVVEALKNRIGDVSIPIIVDDISVTSVGDMCETSTTAPTTAPPATDAPAPTTAPPASDAPLATDAPAPTTAPPASVAPPATDAAAPTTDAPGSVTTQFLEFRSFEDFDEELLNPQSNTYRNRVSRTKRELEPVFRGKYSNFKRLDVLGFGPGSIVTFTSVVFNNSGSIPNGTEVVSALQEAFTVGNVSIPLNVSSISPILTGPATTTSTTSTSTTTESTLAVLLEFASDEQFVSGLSDPKSQVFRERVTETRSQLEPLFLKAFPNFRQLIVLRFRNGTIITEAVLILKNEEPVPTTKQVEDVLAKAVENGEVTFPIISSSISATGPSSSGVSPLLPSVFSCSLMAWCSLLLVKMLNLS